MSKPVPAQFAFLTMPDRSKQLVLNVQVQGEEIQRFELSRDHLFGLNRQAADLLIYFKDGPR